MCLRVEIQIPIKTRSWPHIHIPRSLKKNLFLRVMNTVGSHDDIRCSKMCFTGQDGLAFNYQSMTICRGKRFFQFDVNMRIGMEFCKDALLLTRTDLKTSPPAILMSPCTSFLDENKWHRQGRRFNFVTVIIPLNMTVISLTVHTWFLLHWYHLLNLPRPEH